MKPGLLAIIIILNLVWVHSLSQSAASCVHSKGVEFLLDAYLGGLGACNCQRSGIILTDYQKCNKDPYVLEFEDNFEGDTLNTSKWRLSPATQGALEGAQRVDIFTIKNVEVSDGMCHIIGKKEKLVSRVVNYLPDSMIMDDGKPNLRTYDYTSSMLVSLNKYFHGKYEIRCKMPKGNGLWPAFWLFGFGSKRYNEIDIFDNYEGSNTIVNCIYQDFDGSGTPTGCHATFKGHDLNEWHTYTCIFETDQISFLVDGDILNILPRVITTTGKSVNCGDNIDDGTYFEMKSYPLEPMNIIFNLALTSQKGPGGSVPIDDTTPFPSSFDIDYIRFYKKQPDNFSFFPNPVKDFLTVNSEISPITFCQISNLEGRTVVKKEINANEGNLDLSTLPDGLYLLTLYYNGGSINKKLVKLAK